MTNANSVGHKIYSDEIHETVFLPTLMDAMHTMFKTFQVPRYTQRLGVDAIVNHYQNMGLS